MIRTKPIEIFNSGYSVTIKTNKNDYEYTFIDESNIKHVVNGRHPTEITNRDNVGKQLLNIVNKCDIYSYATKHNIVVDFVDHKSVDRVADSMIKDILNELKMYLIKINEEVEEADRLSILEIQSHYDLLYDDYTKNRDYLGVSDIEYIHGICKHMGVDIEDVILNSYITYLLTLLDIRATNLIVIGGPATGKTFSSKEALRFVPDKYKHIGTYTESYFFNKFNGQDLSRHIFYMGDLGGGEVDDEKTIATRNIFKELISDGYINRGLNLDGEVVEQFVTGKPAIVYTTVTEEIINEQEKSRSNIVKPTEPDKDQLMLFNTRYSTPGKNINNLKYIDNCVESVKGFTNHLIKEINHFEFFNPYLLIIRDFFSSMNEFNRKIDEFTNMLNIVSLLNNPYTLKHNYYKDENNQNIETNLVLIRWEDIINCMSLFNGNNLLPTEKELLVELCKNYSSYDDDFIGSLKEYEEYVSEELIDESGIIRWVGIQENNKDCFFTVKSVKKDSSNSNAVRHYSKNLSDKLRTFYEHNYLIKVGNTERGENIYGLSFDIKSRIYNNVPQYDEKRIEPMNQYFKNSYPDLFEEYLKFIKEDNTEIFKPSFKSNIDILDKL